MAIQTVIDMRPATANELTTAERAELGRYEAVIKRGLDTFVEVGNALVAIRDGKLYRADYSTFDEYCRGRWQISRSYAHRMIDAAQVVENLLPIGNILPANEAQARPLTKLEPDQQRVVWQEAVSEAGGKPTAAQVERAVERVRPPRPKPTPPPSKVVYTEPQPKPAPKPSTIERINRDLDAYDAAMRREHAHLLPEPTPQRPSDDVLHAQQDQLLDAIVENIANRGQVTSEAAPDPLGVRSVEFMPYDELREAKFMLQQVNSGWRWVWHRFDGDVLGNVKAAKAAAITEARRHYEKFHGAADAPDPDEAEAIALVAAETAQEDAERAARDAERPSFERVPEPVVTPATDALERLKRASLLRYMLIQARDAARRDYFDLVGLDVVVSRYARAVDEMLPPLDSFIRCLEGKE